MRDYLTQPITASTTVAAPLERIFALSTRVELVRETLGMKLVDGVTSGWVSADSRVVWRGWKFGLPTEHHTRITGFAAPHAGRVGDLAAESDGQPVAWFEDSQERGRFARFRHEHLFRQRADGVQLEDHVYFSLPFGALGQLVAAWIMAPYIERLCRRRFARLKALAESDAADGWRAWV